MTQLTLAATLAHQTGTIVNAAQYATEFGTTTAAVGNKLGTMKFGLEQDGGLAGVHTRRCQVRPWDDAEYVSLLTAFQAAIEDCGHTSLDRLVKEDLVSGSWNVHNRPQKAIYGSCGGHHAQKALADPTGGAACLVAAVRYSPSRSCDIPLASNALNGRKHTYNLRNRHTKSNTG